MSSEEAARRAGIKVQDVDLWELNEAFAVQVLYCRDRLQIPDEHLNVSGGAIALGHPLRSTIYVLIMSGSNWVGFGEYPRFFGVELLAAVSEGLTPPSRRTRPRLRCP